MFNVHNTGLCLAPPGVAANKLQIVGNTKSCDMLCML